MSVVSFVNFSSADISLMALPPNQRRFSAVKFVSADISLRAL